MDMSFNTEHANDMTVVAACSGEDVERDDFLLTHAPNILAALIVRRHSTTPDELVPLAISATARLFEQIRPRKNLV